MKEFKSVKRKNSMVESMKETEEREKQNLELYSQESLDSSDNSSDNSSVYWTGEEGDLENWTGEEGDSFLETENKDSDSDTEQNSDTEQQEDQEEIQVEFDFKSFDEIDYHGLKTLLKQVFMQDIDKVKDGQLADFIIKNNVGCVVKIDDQLDPFAVITCLDLADEENTGHLVELIKEKSSDSFQQLLANNHCGLLLNDRVINMPPQIAPKMFSFLMQDLAHAKYDYLIYISKTYRKVKATSKNSKTHESHQSKKVKTQDVKQEYYQVEDEFIEPLAENCVEYSLPLQQVSDSRRVFDDDGIEQARKMFILDFKKMNQIIDILDHEIV